MKNTVSTLLKQKQEGKKISMLTCYDYSTAKLMEEVGVNTILVGVHLEIQCLDMKIQFR